MSEQMFSIEIPESPNFEWQVGEDFSFVFTVNKTLRSRLKWWIATKIFLPGTYRWR